MWTHTGDFTVYLSSVLTLRVRVFGSCHLQHTHPEGIDIHGLVVVLLVHLRRHELGRACIQRICSFFCLFKALKRIHSTSVNINVESNRMLLFLIQIRQNNFRSRDAIQKVRRLQFYRNRCTRQETFSGVSWVDTVETTICAAAVRRLARHRQALP